LHQARFGHSSCCKGWEVYQFCLLQIT
jgi:hypothetical protein